MNKQALCIKWFDTLGYQAKEFQLKTWKVMESGASGLLNAATGSGKTLSVFAPIIANNYPDIKDNQLIALWITPLRSLSNEIAYSTQQFANKNNIEIRIEVRNGDTSVSDRKKQRSHPPFMLVITPESLHLLLSYKDSKYYFRHLKYIVVDEWHELIGSKRGVQTELALASLKHINPFIQIWGISATIGNLKEAMDVLLYKGKQPVIIKDKTTKKLQVNTLLPDEFKSLRWAGHLGINLLDKVIDTILSSVTTLVFTNTRAQSELWYKHILEAYPGLAGQIALHHGSLSKDIRNWVEQALKNKKIKAAVCTSSLDLGVDFPEVDKVIQIGGPKGVARFIQRAGRSGHQPGAKSNIYFVPTHALEIVEALALKDAIKNKDIEDRKPQVLTYDVLVQFVITMALSGLYTADDLKEIVLNTHAFHMLTDEEWKWILNFVRYGSQTLEAYDSYKKVIVKDGRLKVENRGIAMRHRMHIGTIVSDNMLHVKYSSGTYLGSIEEWIVGKLKEGDTFTFAGRQLEVKRIKESEIEVKRTKKMSGLVVSYAGGRLPLSAMLGKHIRNQITPDFRSRSEESPHLKELFAYQKKRSRVPGPGELLLEKVTTREGHHLFCYPFEGRFVHEAMASILAYRLSLIKPITFSFSANDYGFELLSASPWNPEIILDNNLFTTQDLFEDLNASMNASEFAKRKFRDIAVIAGLVFQGYPGANKKTKQLQASSQLLFSVFRDYEPNNLLYRQSFTETYAEALQEERLYNALEAIKSKVIVLEACKSPSPFAFPIFAEFLRSRLSSEKFEERMTRMIKELNED